MTRVIREHFIATAWCIMKMVHVEVTNHKTEHKARGRAGSGDNRAVVIFVATLNLRMTISVESVAFNTHNRTKHKSTKHHNHVD